MEDDELDDLIRLHNENPLLRGEHIEARCTVGLSKARLRTYELAYRFGEADFRLQPKAGSGSEIELVTTSDKVELKPATDRSWLPSHPTKFYRFPLDTRTRYKNVDFIEAFEWEFEELMDSIYYLGPLREHPRREYPWRGTVPDGVGPRGELTVDAILAATIDLGHDVEKQQLSFQETIAHCLRDLELIQEFRIEEIMEGINLYRTIVQAKCSSVSTALTDVGFGVSQVLPVLVLLHYVPKNSTVLLEQPELHLHPSAQSGLADIMLNVAKTRDVQIIVESHSEHLLRRLQRRVAEEEASSEDVKLYFVSSERGVARASDLELNEWGEIENWPKEFFGDEMGEISAIMEASLGRKLRQQG